MQPSPRPVCVYQALLSLNAHEWASLARDLFRCAPAQLGPELVMRQILQTNTCSNLDPPIEVHIDREGWYTLLIYDPKKEGLP